ncbi:MAG: right-handed parallel beta-helix repeat-containing protein [Thermoplasmatota archaeon]
MKSTVGLLGAALLLAALPLAFAGSPADVIVSSTQTWGSERHVVHDLVVAAPATLTLAGTQLVVADQIVVEKGARLVLEPGSQPSDVGPLATGAPDETTGFWMQVNGTLESHGLPATHIHGLRGTGLNNLYFPGGGIQVRGTANLTDVLLEDGNGTLEVNQGGTARLDDATVRNMGFLGLGALGPLEIRHSTVSGSEFGLMGKTVCDFTVEDSTISARSGEPIMDNGCPLTVARSVLEGGSSNGIYAAGLAHVNLTDVHLSGYGVNGLMAEALMGDVPQLHLDRVTLDGGNDNSTSRMGIRLQGATADVQDSDIRGNFVGIGTGPGSLLSMANTSVVRSQGVGVLVMAGRVAGDLLAHNHFGSAATRDGDTVPLMVHVHVPARLTGPYGAPLPRVTLKVFGASDPKPLAWTNSTDVNGTAATDFLAYVDGANGTVRYLGPFTYELDQASLALPLTGPLDIANPVIDVRAPGTIGSPGPGLLVSVALLGAALVARRE